MIKIKLNLEQAEKLKAWIGSMTYDDTEKICKEANMITKNEVEECNSILDEVYDQLNCVINDIKNKKDEHKKKFKEVIENIKKR